MTRYIALSLLASVVWITPTHAQFVRRPLLNRFISSPFIHDAANLALSYYHLPMLPNLPSGPSGVNISAILVDSSVKGNLQRTSSNLKDADDIMKLLVDKYKPSSDKAAITFIAIDAVVQKSGTSTVNIVLDIAAPTALQVTASASNLVGLGSISSGAKSGTVTIISSGISTATIEIDFAIAATDKSKAATLKRTFSTK